VDALTSAVAQMRADTHTSSETNTEFRDQTTSRDIIDAKAHWVPRTELDDAVAELKCAIEEAKTHQSTGLRKERGVLEAVLTQKLDKRVADKVHDAVQNSVSENIDREPKIAKADFDKVVDRMTRVTAEVDRQARFLGTLDAKVRDMIARAVREAIEPNDDATSSTASPPSAMPIDPADIKLEDAPSLDTPRSVSPNPQDTSADKPLAATESMDGADETAAVVPNDNDEIDMVKAGDDEPVDGKPKRARAPPRKRK
jgi:hypothetical protein